MSSLNIYGRFFNVHVEELLASLRELLPERDKLAFKDRLLDDEIDYSDNKIEIHIGMGASLKGSPTNRYILSGNFQGSMDEAVLFFTVWRKHFKERKINCDFEITEEDETGKEINAREIRE